MFPLGTVLFPHAPLPLHIFEPRYRTLVQECIAGDGEFGVVLIERGFEVGGGDTRFGTGTVARLVEAAELPDGRWVITTVGTRRVRVATWLPDDPYPVAEVEDLPDLAVEEGDADPLARAEQAVRRALAYKAELGEPAVPATVTLDDEPIRRACQLAAIAPLGPVDHQRLLESTSANALLEGLAEMAEDAATLLAYRLSG
ncbi:MAG TPA: LON peptidase substrate-binding domain-containing protein [Acidimicrobiales bacterium]|nr:LON peptidase substrate-binding domain-containing protein [Acidimicrobiales bacterium]